MRFVITVIVIIYLSSGVSAQEYTYRYADVGDTAFAEGWSSMLENLPPEISDEIESIDPLNPAQSVRSVKEKTGISYWLGKVSEGISSCADRLLPDIAAIISIMLLMAMVSNVTLDLTPGVSGAFLMFSKLVVAISVFRTTYIMIDTAQTFLTSICNLMTFMTPVMQAVYIAEGSLTQMQVSASGVMLAVTVIGNVNTYIIAPFTSALFTLAAVSSVCSDIKLSGITDTLRRLIMRIWQIVSIFFTFMLGTQTVIARSADNLASRTAKFALGSLIPVAGSVIAEAFNTIKEGVSFLRNASGIGGIITIILILLTGIIPLVIYKFSIITASAASDMLKLDGTSQLFKEVAGIVDLLIAVVLYTSLMLIFAMVLFTKSQTG